MASPVRQPPYWGSIGLPHLHDDVLARLNPATAEYDAGNSGAAITLDWTNGRTQIVTLTANCAVTLTNPEAGGRYLVAFVQGAGGGFTPTLPASVRFEGDTVPTWSTDAGAIDLVALAWVATLGIYLAAANTNYGAV